ncbi:MAG TPA: hypothetical protein PLA54_11605, partial [Spirochaetota bacterium]|nr:hypothetical protein [Spirochaetota bacterium]
MQHWNVNYDSINIVIHIPIYKIINPFFISHQKSPSVKISYSTKIFNRWGLKHINSEALLFNMNFEKTDS